MPTGKTYTKIASQTLSSTTATVTFSNLPQNYTDLVVIVTNAQSNTSTPGICVRFNGDSGNNYSHTYIEGSGSAATSSRQNDISYINSGYNIGLSPTSNQPGAAIFNIMGYSNINFNKGVIGRFSVPTATYPGTGLFTGTWRNKNAITSLSFVAQSNSFASGAIFTVYGIEAAKSPKADGGSSVYSDGTYWYHVFYNSGLFVPKVALTVDYLVVAGGGAGGGEPNNRYNGGGGGAGGLRCTVTATGGGGTLPSAFSATSGIGYTVTVGAGGAGTLQRGSNGSSSSISGSGLTTISCTGGGGGGSADDVGSTWTGANGGSGGGVGGYATTGGSNTAGTGTANEGYAGGTAVSNFSGGGGGAGAAGSNGSAGGPGAGGNGVTTSISGVSTTYAGGGGGGRDSGSGGAGGSGGGGAGGALGSSATANTGGGGGGSGQDYATNAVGGSGASGIVIMRYAV